MISYSHFIILFEGKASDLRSKYPHLSQLTDKHLVKYGEALGKMPDLPSDASKLTSVLSGFDNHGSKLDQKDFHRYDSFRSVEESLRPHLERAEKSKKLSDESPVVFKGDNTTVRHIKTYEAASSGPYCKNTKWCVTGSDSQGYQHWNHYSRGGANRMYVIHTPEGKYAYHEGESGIARDATDYGVELEHLVKKYPELKKSEELKGSKYGHIFGNDKLNGRLDEFDRSEVAKHPEHAGKLVNDQSWVVRYEVAKHPEHAGKLVNDPEVSVRYEVAKHPEHAGKLVNDRSWVVRSEVARYPEHAGKLVNDPEVSVRSKVAKHPEHAGKLVNDPELSVRYEVAKHPEHAGYLVNDPEVSVRSEVARYPEHAGKLVNDPEVSVRYEVAKHPEHAGKLVNDQSWVVRSEVAKHPEHAGKLVNDPEVSVRSKVAKHPEHAGKLVNDQSWAVRSEVAKYPEHAGKLVNDHIPEVANRAKWTMKAKATEDQL